MSKPIPVAFSREQLEHLRKVFPPQAFGYEVTTEQLRHYNGQQSVMHYIQERTRGVDPRGGIPTP